MTENNSPKNEHDGESREEKINALLDGELNADESKSLKRAATTDQDLAADIVEAYQLQRAMEHVQVEKAPASLRRKLKLIPRQNRPVLLQPRWVMAFAVVPLMLISVALMRSPETPESPAQGIELQQVSIDQTAIDQTGIVQTSTEQARIDQARQDLAVAFAYIDQVSDRTSSRIETELGGGMSQAVAGSIFKTIQHQKIL